jgi:type I restriction enzyme, S subunit
MTQALHVIPERWIWTTLDDLGSVSGGVTKNAGRADQAHRVPYLRVANVYANRLNLDDISIIDASEADLKRTLLKKWDLLVVEGNGSIDQIGRVALWNGAIDPCLHQNHIIKVRFTIADVARFMLHWLLSSQGRREVVRVASSTSGLHTLSLSKVQSLPVCLAPLHEQQRITAALDSYLTRLDETTALLERAQRNLKRYRASVLKAAVEGRLVPTEAELARAEKRDYEPASVLLERILVERRQRWEKEGRRGKYEEPEPPHTKGLPDLPKGWCWATVEQLLERPLSHGRSVPDASTGFPVLRLTAIKGERIDLSERKIGLWSENEARPFLIAEGDFLVSRGNGSIRLVGRGALVSEVPDPVAFPDTLIRVRFCSLVNRSYIARIWDSPPIREYIERCAKTTAGIHKINQGDLRATPIALPPIAEQGRIFLQLDELLASADHVRKSLAAQLARCARLRQSILKWAFEGKLVDQDPNDEPASALLQRIRDKREPKPSPTPRRAAGRPRAPKKEPHP